MTRIPRQQLSHFVSGALALLLLGSGCAHKDAVKPAPLSATDQQTEAQFLQNNPNMPPAEKAGIIAQMRRNAAAQSAPASR